MTVRFTKKFPNYEAATRWLYAHSYPTSIVVLEDGSATITLEGAHAIRAIEEQTNAKALTPEAA